VSIEGNTLLAGAMRDTSDAGVRAGSVVVYRYGSEGWLQEARIPSPVAEPDSRFGSLLALSGDTALIAGGGPPWVYVHGEDGWVLEGPLDVSPWATIDAIALRGDHAAAIYTRIESLSCETEVRVFERRDGAWEEEITLPTPMCGSGGVLLTDARLAYAQVDTVYVLRNDGGDWIDEAELSTGPDSDYTPASLVPGFTSALAMTDTLIVVGSPMSGEDYTGEVYVFERDATGWVSTPTLTHPNPQPYTFFGWSVAVTDGRIVAGAPTSTMSSGRHAGGRVYVFEHIDHEWTVAWRLDDEGSDAWDAFGAGVAADGDRVAVGEPGYDVSRGAVWVYDLARAEDAEAP
jgi:hypothetical protein